MKYLMILICLLMLALPVASQEATPAPVTAVIESGGGADFPDVTVIETLPLETLYVFGGLIVFVAFVLSIAGVAITRMILPVLKQAYEWIPEPFQSPAQDAVSNTGAVLERYGDAAVIRIPGNLDDQAWAILKDAAQDGFRSIFDRPSVTDVDNAMFSTETPRITTTGDTTTTWTDEATPK